MKRFFSILLAIVALFITVWLANRRPVTTGAQTRNHTAERPFDRAVQTDQTVSPTQTVKSTVPKPPYPEEAWVKAHSAGLVISQAFDLQTNEPTGTVRLGNVVLGLGETPPIYRYQLQAAGYPVMLGDKHQRRTFEIQATSLILGSDGAAMACPLSVSYPRWPGPNAGLENSGGFVFMRHETPLTKIGVIVPKVIPENGESAADFDWQIQIRVNDKLSDVDVRTKAKPQSLGNDVTVLMATHPDNIPANSLVVWFKFEKDGTVLLLDD